MFRRRRRSDPAGHEAQVDAADGDESGWTPDRAVTSGQQADGLDEAEAEVVDGADADANADAGAGARDGGGAADAPSVGVPADRSQGPWDAGEVADPEADGRLNLGSMWLPGVPGMELRVEVDQETGSVAAVTAVLEQSALQVQPFAAPRTSGIWDEVRADIAAGVQAQGGGTAEREGPFGTELHAEIPVQLTDGTQAVQAARFVGVDGPRWFLRGVFTGEAYVDAQAAAPLEEVFRGIVVVRGDAPRTRGEPLELTLPVSPETAPELSDELAGDEEAGAGAGYDQQQAADQGRPPLEPFRRGPEITEVR